MEAYIGLKGDLDCEKRSMQKKWAKREKHLDGPAGHRREIYARSRRPGPSAARNAKSGHSA